MNNSLFNEFQNNKIKIKQKDIFIKNKEDNISGHKRDMKVNLMKKLFRKNIINTKSIISKFKIIKKNKVNFILLLIMFLLLIIFIYYIIKTLSFKILYFYKVHRLLDSNKYNSFVSEKKSNYCQWFVDGKDYFEDLYEKLMEAKESIYITDWWMSPELFLIRPVNEQIYIDMAKKGIITKDFGAKKTRLMDILDYKERQGVKIYILVFFEWPLSLNINSKHTENTIKKINENINIIRYPLNQESILWTNHEKLVIIDKIIGYVGGFDLCWGRYDSNQHPINEEPNQNNTYEFPLIDYSNERIAGFKDVNNYIKEIISRKTQPRLPWHDVQSRIIGPSVDDLMLHFIQRWNHAIYGIAREKIINEESSNNGNSLWDKFKQYFTNINNEPKEIYNIDEKIKEFNLTILKIDRKSEKLEKEIYKKYISEGIAKSNIQALRSISEWSTGVKGSETSILKAYYELIENSKHYIYIENQFFISKSWTDEEKKNNSNSKKISDIVKNEIALYIRKRIEKAYLNKENFKVYFFLSALPDYPGEIEENSISKIILKFTRETISKNYGLSLIEQLEKRMGDQWKNYIGFYSLRNHGIINNIPKTEIIYIHSKLMIVDDIKVLISSANINDRSMLGIRDSEFGVLIEEEKDYYIMNGENDYKAAKFAVSLRKKLMAEHLGININDPILEDPVNNALFSLIANRAKNNTEIYRELFGCYPDDSYNNFDSLKKGRKIKEQIWPELFLNNYKRMKNKIVGHIIEYPLKFLKDENLGKSGSFFNFEKFLPEYGFT